MHIALLGPLEVTDGSGRPAEVGGLRLRTLLTLLALDAGRVVSTERLIDGVWGDDPPSGAANALQSLVSRLRRALPGAPIDSRPSGYRLAVDDGAIDVRRFDLLVARGRSLLANDPAGAAEVLAEALDLWRGPALAEVCGAAFARGHASRLAEQRLGAIEDRVEALLLLGRADVAELESQVAAHPLRERLRGQYMRALCAAGRRADALAAFDDARRTLAEELGVDPSAELRAVHLAVLREEPSGLARERARTNLRARLTSFIGREEEIGRVGKLLEENRLVTLTGPGGAGKTRLAIEAAERLADRMPGGIWLAELAPVGDPAEVPQTLLTVLGVREKALVAGVRGPSPTIAEPVERLVAALSGERPLIVLDNCEHLIDAVARLADRVLADCPGVRILATSREALGITGETLCPVPPLAFPGERAPVEEVLSYPAVRLLAERAAAVRPGFSAGDDLDAVLAICRRLDGLPLAIELAAARLHAMTAGQVAARLDDRFQLLTCGSRTALPRHQTLRAVVDWSWDLLDDAERVLLRRLSVFSGSATLDGIEEICGGDVLDALTGLVEKSLVSVDDTGRYRLLETIRAYGLERLTEAGEQRRVRCAHARHFLELAETAEPLLRTRDQLSWLSRLTEEYDNLHSALRWAIEIRDPVLAVRYVAALGWYWFLRGQRAEAEQLAREAVAVPGGGAPLSRAIVEVYLLMGCAEERPWEAAEMSGRLAAVVAACADTPADDLHPLLRIAPLGYHIFDGRGEKGLAGLVELCDTRDPWMRATARMIRGHTLINLGRIEGVEEMFASAIAEFRALGEQWGLSLALTGLAEIKIWKGETDTAKACIEEALTCSERFGVRDDSSHLRARLAQAYTVLGDERRARAELRLVLRGAERRGAPEDLAVVDFVSAEIARREGDLATARALLERAAAHSTRAGPPQFGAMINVQLGAIHALGGDLTAARARNAEAFRLAKLSHDSPVIGQVLVGFADHAERAGRPEHAATLLGASVGVRGIEDHSLPDPPRIERAVRSAIGDARFTAAYTLGRRMRLPDIDAYLAT